MDSEAQTNGGGSQAEPTGKGISIKSDHYVKAKTASGKPSFDSDDETAQKLRGMDLEDVYTYVEDIAEKHGVDLGDLRKKYSKLNAGMQRMNLGNRLRAVVKAVKGK